MLHNVKVQRYHSEKKNKKEAVEICKNENSDILVIEID